jgi:hypothetical protein
MDLRVQNKCRLASGRHLRSLVIVPSLLVMPAFPASAQTNSDPWIKRTDSTSARNQLELNHSSTSLHLAKTKARSSHVADAPKTKAMVASVDSKTKGAQPEPNLGTKKAGSAVLINIDKTNQKMTNQKMTVFLDGVEKYDWPVSTGKAGYSTPSGT